MAENHTADAVWQARLHKAISNSFWLKITLWHSKYMFVQFKFLQNNTLSAANLLMVNFIAW